MTQPKRVGVLGARGFVGRAVVRALEGQATVIPLSAPRLSMEHHEVESGPPKLERQRVDDVASLLLGLDVVINAAGNPDASSMDSQALLAANALMPLLVYRASQQAQVQRFVHISSAVVQGDRPSLDASPDWRPFSPYSQSKVVGEKWLSDAAGAPTELVIYRPPSVHAPGRGVTVKIARLARGSGRSVAGSGDRPTPQALLENVADAVRFLAMAEVAPPKVVHHPWEGMTTATLMSALGGRDPRCIPASVCSVICTTARWSERVLPRVAPNRRRLEMMWFGQGVEPSWLTSAGWSPPKSGLEPWVELVADSKELEG